MVVSVSWEAVVFRFPFLPRLRLCQPRKTDVGERSAIRADIDGVIH